MARGGEAEGAESEGEKQRGWSGKERIRGGRVGGVEAEEARNLH